ncbi:hypothetical protein H6778_02290 [Candidatus Nomurabacteria bacterium]|nr:hypothetical protein [Candidatus Nomurabacteria bacterium]
MYLLSLALTCFLVVQPVVVSAKTAPDRSELLAEITRLQALIIELQAIVDAQTLVVEANDHPLLSSNVSSVAEYWVTGEADLAYVTNLAHRAYFSRVFTLFPDAYDLQLARLRVFGDDDSPYDAFVETLPPEYESWVYAVHEDVVGWGSTPASDELIVHELGHIISYEEIVGVPKPAEAHCHAYFDRYGCPLENSFLAQFIQAFWSEQALDRAGEYSERPDGTEAAYTFYDAHSDAFVSEYAAIGPEEDFAESFATFVLGERSGGALAREKVDFFWQYPHLRVVRDEIRQQLE